MPYSDDTKRKEYSKIYYQNNKEKFYLKSKEWSQKNKEARKKIWDKYNKKKSTMLKKIKWHENKFFESNATKIGGECYLCKKVTNLVIHHKDGCNGRNGKTLNNHPDNLIILCRSCHPKIHNRWGVKEVGDE